MRRVMGAVAVVVLAGAISKAMGDYRENAADAVGEQVERAQNTQGSSLSQNLDDHSLPSLTVPLAVEHALPRP